MAEKDKANIKSCCSEEIFNKKIDPESPEIKVDSCCKNNVKKKIESESLKGQEIELLPPLLPSGIGRIMVFQYIRHSKNEDQLNFLLPFGFAIGCVSFAIALHSTGVEYVFNQFGAFFAYIPRRVEKVREAAHRINQTLCILQILMALVMFAYCLHWESEVTIVHYLASFVQQNSKIGGHSNPYGGSSITYVGSVCHQSRVIWSWGAHSALTS